MLLSICCVYLGVVSFRFRSACCSVKRLRSLRLRCIPCRPIVAVRLVSYAVAFCGSSDIATRLTALWQSVAVGRANYRRVGMEAFAGSVEGSRIRDVWNVRQPAAGGSTF